MSTLAVNAVTDANGGNTATINSMTPTADSLQGFRNRLINSDMRIDQRNAGAAVTTDASYVVDRYRIISSNDGAFSAQQDSSAPAGFTNSVKFTITTADSSLTTTQNLTLFQRIEGYNIADWGWGTASAKTVTLSFWVRSSLTGTFGGALRNSDSNRSYPFTYSISAANTWEQKSVTIAGDTSGTWVTNSGIGVNVFFCLGAGPDRSGTAGSWNSNNNLSATGAVNVLGTLNATWYITGVQLEVGSVASNFERRPYGTEVALCQRYFYLHSDAAAKALGAAACTSTTQASGIVYFPVQMRVSPTLYSTLSATNKFRVNSNVDSSSNDDMTIEYAGLSFVGYSVTGFSGFTTGYAGYIRRHTATGVLGFTAEL